ncbi:MAG: hypothetical protein Ct9H300mP21_09240 [Pseudomonadota bacterium]|nr:MAG: hypothetical protein Ct9H300mP21_09240 [Pseudomonadota bacterium]
MYAWDHIRGHADRLRNFTLVTASGILQFFTGLGLIISGIILLLYGHMLSIYPVKFIWFLTFVLAGSLIMHKISRK